MTSWRRLLPLLKWVGLAFAALVALWLFQYGQRFHPWGQERAQALLALVGLVLGVALAGTWRRRDTAPDPKPPPALPEAAADAVPADSNPLSPRERELLGLLDRGLSNKEIARLGGISENTVKTHLARIYEKLGARRRTEALALARSQGWLPRHEAVLTRPGDRDGANG